MKLCYRFIQIANSGDLNELKRIEMAKAAEETKIDISNFAERLDLALKKGWYEMADIFVEGDFVLNMHSDAE